jgi:hypothetical protein
MRWCGLIPSVSSLVQHHGHEAVVHVQLLVAVKKRRTGIVCRKIHLDLLLGGHDDDVFPDARRRFAGESGQLEGVPVQVDRVRFITLVIEAIGDCVPGEP